MKSAKLAAYRLFLTSFAIIVSTFAAAAQTSTFTYQGRLSDGAAQASGTYDLGFALFDQAAGGAQIGTAQTRAAVNVSNGVFTVQLDFGAAAFPGANRFLEITVKRPSDANFTTLAPRQPVTSTPYAIRALNATNADNATTAATATTATMATTATNAQQLGGTAASGFVQTDSTAFVRSQTTQQTSSNFNIDGTGTANVFNAATQYNIGGSRVLFTDGDGGANTFLGLQTGRVNSSGSLNAFGGYLAGSKNTSGGSNTIIGANARISTFASALNHATAIGADSNVFTSDTIALGRINGTDTVYVYGGLKVTPGVGGIQQLCVNAQSIVSVCSSSLRYKTNIAPFSFGLNLVRQLQPISFDWRDGGMKDVGFGAEDVAKINPQLVIYNKEGQVEGVKYDRFSVLFVNAFKEQQTQIEAKQSQLDALQERIERQQTTIDALKKLLCAGSPTADVCRQP